MLKARRFLVILLPLIVNAQFSDYPVLGPTATVCFSGSTNQIRVSGRVRISGDYLDIETDLLTFSALLDKEDLSHYGVSWTSLLWVPPLLVGRKFSPFNAVAIALMSVNGLLNADFSIGNSWIRGTVGWKNDIFIYKDFLWIFSPEVGCKISLPRKWISDGGIRLCMDFPAMAGNNVEFIGKTKMFRPRLSFGVDVLFMYADICLGGK